MKLSILLLAPALLAVNAQWLEQTDWSGGPGVPGPTYWFNDTFLDYWNVNWFNPGEITIGAWSRCTLQNANEFPAIEDYYCSGILTSSIAWIPAVTDQSILWGDLWWTCYEPDSTEISFQLRTGYSPETMGSWGSPIYDSGTYLGDLLPDDILLIQYRVILASTSTVIMPVLFDLTIEGYYPDAIAEEGTCTTSGEGMLFIPDNPATGPPQVKVRMPSAGRAMLGVYDLSGRSILDIFEGYMQAGESSFILGELIPGVYIIRLDAILTSESEKLIVLH